MLYSIVMSPISCSHSSEWEEVGGLGRIGMQVTKLCRTMYAVSNDDTGQKTHTKMLLVAEDSEGWQELVMLLFRQVR
jgi:hypothetical protein